MNELEIFFQLPLLYQALFVCCSVFFAALLVVLIFAPRRDCCFLRWSPEARMLALLAAPVLFLTWPILLYGWILRRRGIDPADPDWSDD
jgi:cytochrome bd-type quinol oxidase subunit 1